SELMANVVSGIASAPALFEAAAAGAALPAEAAGAPCGGAAFAACWITARESTITETAGKNKIIHRIFMNQTSVFAVAWNHTARSRAPSRHYVKVRDPFPDCSQRFSSA